MKAKVITNLTFWKSSVLFYLLGENDQFTYTAVVDIIYLLYIQLERRLNFNSYKMSLTVSKNALK